MLDLPFAALIITGLCLAEDKNNKTCKTMSDLENATHVTNDRPTLPQEAVWEVVLRKLGELTSQQSSMASDLTSVAHEQKELSERMRLIESARLLDRKIARRNSNSSATSHTYLRAGLDFTNGNHRLTYRSPNPTSHPDNSAIVPRVSVARYSDGGTQKTRAPSVGEITSVAEDDRTTTRVHYGTEKAVVPGVGGLASRSSTFWDDGSRRKPLAHNNIRRRLRPLLT